MRIKTCFATLLALAVSGAALAQSRPQNPSSRSPTAYVGAGVGYALSDVARDFGDTFYPSVGKSDDSATGYKFYGGVLWGHWGLEVGYYEFGTYGVEGAFNNSAADEFHTTALGISAVGWWPLSSQLSLTGKLGIAPAKTQYRCVRSCAGIPDTDRNSTALLMGLGLGWHLSPNLLLRADWEGIGGVKATGYIGPGSPRDAEYSYNMFSVALEARF